MEPFRLVRPEGFAFRTGQSVKLARSSVRCTYSRVSTPHEAELEFFVELVPGGAMSSRLHSLCAGDRLEVAHKAKSGLTLGESAARYLMVATVTGVNPFVSMLQ